MESKYFLLSSVENNKVVRIIQIAFGLVCLAVAVFWLVFNIRSVQTNSTLWITIIFLSVFGLYQIWSGLGRATRFIEISADRIRLKKTIILPTVEMRAEEIQKIEIYPFNLIFILKAEKRIILRFSTTYQETNEKVKDELLVFGELNSIEVEFVKEKL
jgi:HAMP domain-containing protein